MHVRLSEATVDLSVTEHKICRKKVGAGEESFAELKGQGASVKVKALPKDTVLPTRILSSTALSTLLRKSKELHIS